MTQKQIIGIDELYDRLAQLGLPKTYVRSYALPDWWDLELEQDPQGAIIAATYIAKRLNLDLGSLLEKDASPRFREMGPVKFKTRGTIPEQLRINSCIAVRTAQIVAYACVPEYSGIPSSVEPIKESIRNDPAADGDSLKGLINYCWNHGIPVVYFDRFPSGHLDSMVVNVRAHPVIVIGSNCGWLSTVFSYSLAREIGHISLRHIKEGILVEEPVTNFHGFYNNPYRGDEEDLTAFKFAFDLVKDIGVKNLSQEQVHILINSSLENPDWVDWDRIGSDSRDHLRSTTLEPHDLGSSVILCDRDDPG